MYDPKHFKSATTLATSVDLVAAVVNKVAGNDISTSINGEKLNDTMIETIAANRIIKTLSDKK